MFPDLFPTRWANIDRALRYAKKLKLKGAERIVIRGRLPKHLPKVKLMISSLREIGYQVIMYTGVWGGVDLMQSRNLWDWAQRDKADNPLGYRGSLRSGMLCPESPYIAEVLIPEISELIDYCEFHGVFFDIPWIMKGGCLCKWCRKSKDSGGTNGDIVRIALGSLITNLRQRWPNLDFAVNASAPGLNHDKWSGGHLSNLADIFDEYVTEWNPYRWNQKPHVVANCLSEAKRITTGRFSHATTLTDRYGKLLSGDQIQSLFFAILSQAANPWISVNFNDRALDAIFNAYVLAKYNSSFPAN